jgi:GTP-binding protein
VTGRVVLVGRANVGKSTLFNRLTRSRDALVADVPGLTRDRRYGVLESEAGNFILIDTGGLFGEENIAAALERQVEIALGEADLVLFVTDARAGLTPLDRDIAARLRKRNVPTELVVNKIDGLNDAEVMAEFSALGFAEPLFVAASQGRGQQALEQRIADRLPPAPDALPAHSRDPNAIRVAIAGRPNVGKSTLINRLLGEERQVVFDAPGTTRDAIDIPVEHDGQRYVLIDTAGVRRKGRTVDVVEKFSVVKTLEAMARAEVVLVVLDAREGIVEQDLHLVQYAVDAGAGLIIAVNKWDGLSREEKDSVRRELDRRLEFVPWASRQNLSALHGTGVGHLWPLIRRVHAAGRLSVSPARLTELLNRLTAAHPPPAVRGRPVKLRFAQKVGEHPPHIVIHGSQTEAVPKSYLRYLEKGFRDALELAGNPVRLTLKSAANPFAGRRNELTERQRRRRKRVMTHRRKR